MSATVTEPTSPTPAVEGQVASPPRGLEALRRKGYNLAMSIMRPLADVVARSSRVPTSPILSVEDFPWARAFEQSWREIRRELEGVLVYRDDLPAFHEINGDATTISDERWKSFFFYGFGRRSEANRRRCPITAELISRVPGVSTAFFSIMGPGVRLPPHRGPWKGFIRYHLGLMVPEPAEHCGIRVGGELAHWREGESLVFDDTYEHSAWNETQGTRVVLFLDVERPCRFPGNLVNRSVITVAGLTPFVQDSLRRHKVWERRFSNMHG